MRVLLTAVILGSLLAGCDQELAELGLYGKDIADIECEDVIPSITWLSAERRDPSQPVILKVYDPKELERTATRLNCQANALLGNSEERVITFGVEADRDGEIFYGYQIEPHDFEQEPMDTPEEEL